MWLLPIEHTTVDDAQIQIIDVKTPEMPDPMKALKKSPHNQQFRGYAFEHRN